MQEDPLIGLPEAPSWGNSLGLCGQYSVYLALATFVIALLLSFSNSEKLTKLRRISFYIGCASFFATFGILATLFLKDQFQFDYVFGHSSHENPWSYKLASVWTAQEGSFLLWAFFSSMFGLLTISKSANYERAYTGTFAIFLGVLAAILVRETPFDILEGITRNGKIVLPPDGVGMVPGLQNYWVTIHPPVVFSGFASLTVPFAYGIAAMVHGDGTSWLKLTRAPAIFGMSILGLGISMGGLWAYETQGWGGFWAWDPVENVSLVPWLFLVALVHGIIVQTAQKKWITSNLILSGIPFLAFVYGTFLTRSGLLDKVSVHSFASMDKQALMVLRTFLVLLVLVYIGFILARAIPMGRAAKVTAEEKPGVNRTTFYQLGILSLSLLSFVVAIGMSWAVITAIGGGEGAKVEEDVYHRAVIWFFIPIMLAMGIAPHVSWRHEGLKVILTRLGGIATLSIGFVGALLLIFKNAQFGVGVEQGATINSVIKGQSLPLVPVMALLILLCVFVGFSNLWRALEMAKKSKMGIGSFISHFGIALFIGGLIISRGFEREGRFTIQEGRPSTAMGYTIAFKDYDADRAYDRSNVVKFDVTDDSGKTFEIDPNLYFYKSQAEDKSQVWPYIRRTLSHDSYFFMSAPFTDVWKEPLEIKPGETKTQSKITVKYLKSTSNGKFGGVGAEFGGLVEISYVDEGETKRFQAEPSIKLTEAGLEPSLPQIGPEFRIAALRKNPQDNALSLQLYVSPPIYQIQLFYKPLTILVWLGTAIFTLGGFISAFYRRLKKKAPESDFASKPAKISSGETDAPVTTS